MAATSGSNALHKVSYQTWFQDTAWANNGEQEIKHTNDPHYTRHVSVINMTSSGVVSTDKYGVTVKDENTTLIKNTSGQTFNMKVVIVVP